MKNWDKEEVTEELLNHFKITISEGKEEIENTLSFSSEKSGTVEVEGVEYCIIQNEEEAKIIAKEIVKNDLEEDPTIFNQDWLSNFLYISECDKRIMAGEEENYIREFVEETENNIFESEEERKEWIEQEVKTRLEEFEKGLDNPIDYFVEKQGIYTIEQLFNAPFIQIDMEKAAQLAIHVDGWAHFLSHYDGDYETTNNGLIIFKEC